jgi:hypothetical protein
VGDWPITQERGNKYFNKPRQERIQYAKRREQREQRREERRENRGREPRIKKARVESGVIMEKLPSGILHGSYIYILYILFLYIFVVIFVIFCGFFVVFVLLDCTQEHIAHLFLDGNNMMFVANILRNMTLHKEQRKVERLFARLAILFLYD